MERAREFLDLAGPAIQVETKDAEPVTLTRSFKRLESYDEGWAIIVSFVAGGNPLMAKRIRRECSYSEVAFHYACKQAFVSLSPSFI